MYEGFQQVLTVHLILLHIGIQHGLCFHDTVYQEETNFLNRMDSEFGLLIYDLKSTVDILANEKWDNGVYVMYWHHS